MYEMAGLDPLPYVARGGKKAAGHFRLDMWWFFMLQMPKYILTYMIATLKGFIIVTFKLRQAATEESVIRLVEGSTLGACNYVSGHLPSPSF
jgi:hypothetical protein